MSGSNCCFLTFIQVSLDLRSVSTQYQGCILSLCLFNLYAEYIMRNAGLEEAQAGIKIAGRNINGTHEELSKLSNK